MEEPSNVIKLRGTGTQLVKLDDAVRRVPSSAWLSVIVSTSAMQLGVMNERSV